LAGAAASTVPSTVRVEGYFADTSGST